jgi:hypothetical protein
LKHALNRLREVHLRSTVKETETAETAIMASLPPPRGSGASLPAYHHDTFFIATCVFSLHCLCVGDTVSVDIRALPTTDAITIANAAS